MLFASLLVVAGLALLVWGADRFVAGAAGTAHSLGVAPLIIGLTIVGTATSAPEVLVGVSAALEGKTNIAVGNAIGSNIANIGLVLGVTILCKPFIVRSRTLRREYLLMVFASLLASALMLDHELDFMDGVLLLITLVLLLGGIVRLAKRPHQDDPLQQEIQKKPKQTPALGKSLLRLLFGLVILLVGAEWLVDGAVFIARTFGISELVIGLTIIAIGTSLPELAASIAGVLKGEAGIAIGNVIGSNMFNMLMVLGIPCIINPAEFSAAVIYRDIPVMLLLIFIMGMMLFLHSKDKFDKKEGATLLLCFVSYQTLLFLS
ncbi:MAG: calcium/sodium antiporter [Gammaproteobacteria bacterium]